MVHEERLRRLETNLDRISGLESKIDQLFNDNASTDLSRISQEMPVDPRPSLSIEHQREAPDAFPIPPDLLAAVIDIYFDYVECQPLPLLIRKDSFDFADEVAFGIIAVAARYSTHSYFSRDESSPQVFNQRARTIIFKALETDDATLSTIQATCLISLADYLGK
ncbi:hypothetical protein SLS55_003607 [Diplodia seriata]|uniref:Transcription factor domain-containing protein n=1 Tax=Diplodia seriata TaxID=420778 RepID=A0ABR3CNE8_9PEZI